MRCFYYIGDRFGSKGILLKKDCDKGSESFRPGQNLAQGTSDAFSTFQKNAEKVYHGVKNHGNTLHWVTFIKCKILFRA